MSENVAAKRIVKVASELGVGVEHVIDFLQKKGHKDITRNSKVNEQQYTQLLQEFREEKSVKEESKLVLSGRTKKDSLVLEADEAKPSETQKQREEEKAEILIKDTHRLAVPKEEETIRAKSDKEINVKVVSKIDLESLNTKTKPEKKTKEKVAKEKPEAAETKKKEKEEPKPVVEESPKITEPPKEDFYETKIDKLEGPTILGKINLPVKDDKRKPVASSSGEAADRQKRKRKRIHKEGEVRPAAPFEKKTFDKPFKGGAGKKREEKHELTEEEVQAQIKETLARLSGAGKSKAAKYRRLKREEVKEKIQEEAEKQEAEKKVLKVTEFVSAAQLASMMNVSVTDIISSCMSLGIFVSINQRLDAETLAIVAEEFGYKVEFVSVEVQEAIKEEEDTPESLKPRPPIVTVMGHVDHGKTSLLDFIRKANVIAGEAGGITQHIGAYSVELENGKKITFLDTPGHEAFTAMRARGAQVTDIAIIVVAADDSVMPQTVEAINHAQAAGVPIVFAINKIDKPGANPDKIREALSQMNILVEEWGGKYQCQEISAKKGMNIDLLLEKVLLEAEMLNLRANPDKKATGTIIESSLDKGRGYVATILVEAGTLKVGDVMLAGCFSGRVKALQNERGQTVKEVGPATPALLLGLSGAPQAGDKFNVMADEREAKEIANKRQQLQREQGIRTQKHITLDEIGRRLAIGDFKELNIIVKGDVDGSIEALADSLLKLSTEKVQVNVIHKSVGAITESDVLLASASNAIIVGFQVRPSASARKLAEQEQIDIRLYSVIYKAIEEVRDAMEGMLAPEFEEKIVCNIEVRDVFTITRVGTIAGCMVTDGKVTRQTHVRVIRDGIVIHSGKLGSLKRFKDDVKEVASGFECGLNIDGFNDIKVGDIIEGYEQVEIKAKL